MVILLIGAHPDDIELGAGATIHKLHLAHDFHGVVLTTGSLRGKSEEREAATVSAAQKLGYSPDFARLKDGGFTDYEAEQVITAKIAAIKPDILIGHSRNDKHRDHVVAHVAMLSAARKMRNILFFEGPYSYHFTPQLYVELNEEDMRAKISALAEHTKALIYTPYYLEREYIRSLLKLRARPIGFAYAEVFEVGIVTGLL